MRKQLVLVIVISTLTALCPLQSQASIIGWGVYANTVAKTTDGGNTWTNYASNAGFGIIGGVPIEPMLYAVASPDPNDVWIAGEHGLMMHSSNGGSSWTPQSSSTGQTILRIHFVDANNGWAIGSNGTIVHTSDGGAHWASQRSGTVNGLDGIAFSDSQTGWIVGDNGTILHTTNGGATWTPQNSSTSLGLQSVAFASTTNGWASGFGRTLLHTTDGGNSWLAQIGPFGTANGNTQGDGIFGLSLLDATHFWTAGDEGVGYTADGASTWSTYLTGQGSLSSPVDFVNSQTGWVNDGGILWLTTDGGSNWTRKNSGFNFNDITFQDPSAIPEPTTLALLAASIPLLLRRRQRTGVRFLN